jgi:hypothetical protein
MEAIILQPHTKPQIQAVKAFAKALKIPIKNQEEESPYNPEFVKMIKEAAASKKRYRVDNVDELWESL